MSRLPSFVSNKANVRMKLYETGSPRVSNQSRLTQSITEASNAGGPFDPALLSLPAEPLVVIEPSGSLSPLNLRELWAYRELLYFLTWRDVKVRYKQTALGAAWAIIQPFFTMIVFSLFFGR